MQGVKRVFGSDDKKELVDPYFVFSFAGQEVKSKIMYNSDHPEFNQELRLGLRVSVYVCNVSWSSHFLYYFNSFIK